MIRNGIKIPNLIFIRYMSEDSIHHRANAQESHINSFAGLILKNKNASNVATRIHTILLARYVQFKKVIAAKQAKIIVINHQANPSNQSVILMALTTATVAINVNIGNKIQTWILPAIGHKLI